MKKKAIIQEPLQPMTILMIKKGIKASHKLQLDFVLSEGHPIPKILIVGFAVEILIDEEKQAFTALIEDSTGNLQVTVPLPREYPHWLDVRYVLIDQRLIKVNPKKPGYVRCIVQPKLFKQEIIFKCVFMEIVKNFNVVTLHILDCIKAYQFRKSFPASSKQESNSQYLQIKQNSFRYYKMAILKQLEEDPQTKQQIIEKYNIPTELFEECWNGLNSQIELQEDETYRIKRF